MVPTYSYSNSCHWSLVLFS